MVLLMKQDKTINPLLRQKNLVPRGRVGWKPKNGAGKPVDTYRPKARIEGSFLLNVIALIACSLKRSKELGERIRQKTKAFAFW